MPELPSSWQPKLPSRLLWWQVALLSILRLLGSPNSKPWTWPSSTKCRAKGSHHCSSVAPGEWHKGLTQNTKHFFLGCGTTSQPSHVFSRWLCFSLAPRNFIPQRARPKIIFFQFKMWNRTEITVFDKRSYPETWELADNFRHGQGHIDRCRISEPREARRKATKRKAIA